MTRRLNIWLLSALLIIVIPYYWYLVDPGAGPGSAEPRAKPVTIAQLRALAAAPEGQRPVALRVETVALRYSSRNVLVAGAGLRTVPNTVRSYELVVLGSGLRAGSFMLYAWLEGGRDYLFTGDVAKMSANWQDLLPPARFATRGDPASYRSANLSWLMTINALHRAASQMVVIAGHDPAKVPFSAGTFSD